MELTPFLTQTEDILGKQMSSLSLPEHWRAMAGKAELTLHSRAWSDIHGNQVKCAYLEGPRAEIINLMGYPNDVLHLPVMAVEIILFGKLPRVAVIDLQPASGWRQSQPEMAAKIQSELSGLDEYKNELSSGGELPEWAIPHFTPWCVFSRPQSLQELKPLLVIFKSYLNWWCRQLTAANSSPQGGHHLETYLHHHVENTPGRKFLTTSFGSGWTESYLREFMYCSRPLCQVT